MTKTNTFYPDSPQTILRSTFGYEQFKPLQLEVIQNVLKKRDTIAVMPTGGGKSLCYQIPALLFPGLTVVVSPLISLMKDQVEQLEQSGVPALFLNSTLGHTEYQANMDRVRSGEIKLLYVAPETLLTPRIFNLLASLPLDCLTIDEAHCISEWGHDFRPEYRQIIEVRKRFPGAVCLALTATATSRVRADIKTSLNFKAGNEFVASFNRQNLHLEITPKTDPGSQTLELLKRFPDQSGIIYCFSRKQVDELAAFLTAKGFSVRPYHAGLDDTLRKQNQELFIRDDVQVIVATIAFGMGINKPNVRFIIHFDLPKSIEGYYQEIGRAGRDGLPAHCLLLYSYSDVRKLRYFIDQKEDNERQIAYQHLNALIDYAESDLCRRVPLLGYFEEKCSSENCAMCDNCLKSPGAKVDITIPAQKFLSCVKRSGERFAATHIIHILTGAENEKVLKYEHNTLSTFGIGMDLTRKQWLHISQQLVQKGLLVQSKDMYRTLSLTPTAYEILKNRETIMGLLHHPEAAAETGKAGGLEHDGALFSLLRQKRKELADEARVPPYVIFSDRTLVEMAAFYPMSPASLLKINGVGQVKLERYGEIFLQIIREYCQPRQLTEKLKTGHRTGRITNTGAEKLKINPRHVLVAESYNNGCSITDLIEQYRVQQGTILNYLAKYVQEGNSLRRGTDFLSLLDIPLETQMKALGAFEHFGAEYLKPVFEHLNGQVSYDDLKVLRLHYLSYQK
jgi:ATP-dependent DNA helicase RecQ